LLWIGDRTRQVDGAHVEFLSGVANSVAVKCGPSLGADELLALIDRLDPRAAPGRLTLVARFGADRIDTCLPPLLRACRAHGLAPRWAIDPMHGNTRVESGRKLRRLQDIVAETDLFFAICAAEDVRPGGVHLEMSALDVTECLGGPGPVSTDELGRNWRTACDPRLNREQAIDLATHVAERLQRESLAARQLI
jgi:3-deoxy-7-phosphoheptulonate synthase